MAEEKKNIKVLVVDDERVVRDFLTQLLNANGIETKSAENGFKAIEMARSENFDLFFLDVRMPGIDGLETLRELRGISAGAKYIMITGYAVEEVLEQAKKEGASYSLRKPFDVMQIKKAIDECIKGKVPAGAMKILIVDDEEVVLNFFKRLLSDAVYDITVVKTGKDALDSFRQKEFDLVFLDTVLPDMQGMELYSKIHEIGPRAAIVLITGYVGRCEDVTGLKLNIKGCLLKPFEIDKIYEQINEVRRLKGI